MREFEKCAMNRKTIGKICPIGTNDDYEQTLKDTAKDFNEYLKRQDTTMYAFACSKYTFWFRFNPL